MSQQETREEKIDVVDASLLFDAATVGNLSLLRQQSHNLLLGTRDRHGSSLLHYAAGSGQLECCQYLLKLNIDANNVVDNDDDDDGLLLDIRSSNNGRTALHWAARNGRTDTVRLLAKTTMMTQQQQRQRQEEDEKNHQDNLLLCESSSASSTVSVVDVLAKGEVTPLQLAIWQCHLSTAKCLVEEFQANPYYINGWGCSIAHWLGKCPNNNTFVNNDDDTEDLEKMEQKMMIAIQQQDCCHWLFCEYKIPHNIPNHYGQTPLHKAAFANNFVVAKYLVRNMNVVDNIRDNQGNIAADCAERCQNLEMAQWLRRYASSCIRKALHCLFGVENYNNMYTESSPSMISSPGHGRILMIPPPISKLRERYLQLVKKYHPDRRHHSRHPSPINSDHDLCHHQNYQQSLLCTSCNAATTTMTATTTTTTTTTIVSNTSKNEYWNEIQDSYSLLRDWHENPVACDTRIRIRTRNAALLEVLPLCWYESWHSSSSFASCLRHSSSRKQEHQKQCQSQSSPTASTKNRKETPVAIQTPQAIQEFERRLIRLLTPLGDMGITISQLPKEYEKNWHIPVPKPRDYKCRRLLQLVKKYCPNITVVEEEKGSKDTTKSGTIDSLGGKKKEPRQPSQQARLIFVPPS